jgi:hypothetical protein
MVHYGECLLCRQDAGMSAYQHRLYSLFAEAKFSA